MHDGEGGRVERKDAGMVRHYTSYALGNVLSLLVGFVTFPIMSRMLDNREFGLIAYIDALLLLLMAVLKFGIGDALLRFYPHGQGRAGLDRLVASALLVPLAASTVLLLLVIAWFCVAMWLGWVDYGPVALLALVGVPFGVFTSYAQWIMAAQEKSALNAMTNTIWKWATSMAVIAAVLLVAPTAFSVFSARLLVSLAAFAWLAFWLFKQTRPSRADLDPQLTRTVLAYSLPLALNELAQTAQAIIDRVVLQAMVDNLETVGIYAIGSSLAMYVGMLVGTTLGQAYTPVVNRIYVEQGNAAVVAFKQSMLAPMTYAVALILAGLLLFGADLFAVIAGPTKAASGPVFVVLSIGFCLSALMNMAAYGAILEKRTRALLVANLIAIGVKLVGNFALIPLFGVMGTVYATLVSQVVLAACLYYVCPTVLRSLPDVRDVAKATVLAGVVAMAAGWLLRTTLPEAGHLVRLAIGVPLVSASYVALLLALHPEWRTAASRWWRQRRMRGA